MKKRLAIVAVSLVAVLGMTSCAKEVTAEEANKQANSYSQDDASAKYTSGTLATSVTITSDNAKIKAILTLANMESGKAYTTTTTAPVTVITSATLTSFTSSYESDNIKYYIDGPSVSVKVNYTGTNDDKDYGVTGTATVSAEFKTTGEGLASCSKEVTAEEANKQANSYSQTDAEAKYSGGQLKTEMTITSDNAKVQAALTILGYESGKTYSTTISASIVVITDAELKSVASDYGSEHVKYYIDGSAVSAKVDYSGTMDQESFDISGTANIKGEFKTNGDGLVTYTYAKVSYKNAKMGSTDVGSFSSETKLTYTYTKK